MGRAYSTLDLGRWYEGLCPSLVIQGPEGPCSLRRLQKQQQIPFGNGKQKNNSNSNKCNSNDQYSGPFAPLRMTRVEVMRTSARTSNCNFRFLRNERKSRYWWAGSKIESHTRKDALSREKRSPQNWWVWW